MSSRSVSTAAMLIVSDHFGETIGAEQKLIAVTQVKSLDLRIGSFTC